MSGFSAEWLALRESYDLRARNPIVLDAVAASFKSHDASYTSSISPAVQAPPSARSVRTCRPDNTGISSTTIPTC